MWLFIRCMLFCLCIYIYIVGVSCVLARAKYMAYTFVLMMFWILLIFQLTV